MRVMEPRFKRLMRTKNLEFFLIVSEIEKRNSFLLFCDERTQEKGDDENKISAFLISNFEPSDTLYEDTYNFCEDLLDMKQYCSFSFMNLKMKEAFNFDFPVDMLTVRDYVQKVLTLLKLDIELPIIQESDFNYLSQE